MIITNYVTPIYNTNWLKSYTRKLKKFIISSNIEIDVLVGTGISGTIILPYLAEKLKLKYCIVRKNNESCHSDLEIEGYLNENAKYFIVDDFIDSGNTVDTIINKLSIKHIGISGVIFYFSKNKSYIKYTKLVNKIPIIIYTEYINYNSFTFNYTFKYSIELYKE